MELYRKLLHSLILIFRDEELRKRLLRIGSLEYEALPLVRRYTLDQKVKEIMDGVPADGTADAL